MTRINSGALSIVSFDIEQDANAQTDRGMYTMKTEDSKAFLLS
jgi:hypothetical protein